MARNEQVEKRPRTSDSGDGILSRFAAKYTTRDLMTILVLALVAFVIFYTYKPFEAVLLGLGLGGWWITGFIFGLFNFPAVIGQYKVQKFGTATLILLIAFWIRILLGSPQANILTFYALGWGLTADIVLALFRQKRSLWVYIVTWAIAGLVVFWAVDYVVFREVYNNFANQFGFIAISGIHRVAGGIAGAIAGWFFSLALDRVGLMGATRARA